MANNRIQVKRTSVSTRTPNTTNSSNNQYITAGELALNMSDGILYSSNGSSLIEVGSNNTFQNISTNNLTVGNTLYVVANGNVGIGITTPTAKLEVNGSAKVSSNTANASIYINNNVEITTNSNSSTVSTSNTIITSFSTSNYRGGKFIIMGKRQNDSHMSEVLVTHNNLSAFYNEYGIVYTNTSLYTVSASVVSGNVQIVLTSSFDDMNYDIIENKFIHEQTLSFDFINNSYNLLT